MAETGAPKVCVVCKCDLAGVPRTRDKHGKYFCTACYEKALKAKHDRQARERNAQTAGSTHDASHVDLDALLPNHGEGTGDVLDDLVAPPPPRPIPRPRGHDPRECPACNHVLAVGAVMCTNCGYNLSSGVALHVNLPSSAKIKAPKRTSTTVWAAICLAFGALGVVTSYMVLSGNAPMKQFGADVPRPTDFSLILSLLSSIGLLATGALMLLRHGRAHVVARTTFVVAVVNGVLHLIVSVIAEGGEPDPTLGVSMKTLQLIGGCVTLLITVVFYRLLLGHLRNPATRIEFGTR